MTYRSSTLSVKSAVKMVAGNSGLTVPRLGTAIKGRDRRAPMVAFLGLPDRERRYRIEMSVVIVGLAGFIHHRLQLQDVT
jgi:hypothetical protein